MRGPSNIVNSNHSSKLDLIKPREPRTEKEEVRVQASVLFHRRNCDQFSHAFSKKPTKVLGTHMLMFLPRLEKINMVVMS